MSQQNKILVTGSAGLVGKELVSQLLQQGNSVIALYHQTPLDINHVNLQKVQCDLLDVVTLEEAMKDIDYVYHCAGLVNFTSDNKKKLYKIIDDMSMMYICVIVFIFYLSNWLETL